MQEYDFQESEDLKILAARIISKKPEVAYIDPNDILFLKEYNTKPPAAARTFRLVGHPIQTFRPEPFCIVFYEAVIDYMSPEQRAILMFHELMHIPPIGDKLIDHNIKDFDKIIDSAGSDWSKPNKQVPDILEG